jgi:hypothetical protein
MKGMCGWYEKLFRRVSIFITGSYQLLLNPTIWTAVIKCYYQSPSFFPTSFYIYITTSRQASSEKKTYLWLMKKLCVIWNSSLQVYVFIVFCFYSEKWRYCLFTLYEFKFSYPWKIAVRKSIWLKILQLLVHLQKVHKYFSQ